MTDLSDALVLAERQTVEWCRRAETAEAHLAALSPALRTLRETLQQRLAEWDPAAGKHPAVSDYDAGHLASAIIVGQQLHALLALVPEEPTP